MYIFGQILIGKVTEINRDHREYLPLVCPHNDLLIWLYITKPEGTWFTIA